MKKWPYMDITAKFDKSKNTYKAVAKTKLPCGVPMVEVVEMVLEDVARTKAQGRLLHSAKGHVDDHKCDR